MEILLIMKEKAKKLFEKFLMLIGIDKCGKVYYIGGAETLPPPLSSKEENDALLKLTQNDESIKKVLVERNLRLVVYIAKKFENTNTNIEDLISIGTIGLVKAINTYDVSKNIKLATYASRCIENEILMHLRKVSKLKNEVSIDEPLNTDGDGNELLLSDIIGTDEDVVFERLEKSVDNQLIKESIGRLNKREKIIMELRFGFITGEEKTQKEVADLLRNFSILYFAFRKKNNKSNEEGNEGENIKIISIDQPSFGNNENIHYCPKGGFLFDKKS